MNPRTLFTWLARAEVVTWTLLLIGMALKYVTRTTELGVSVFGLVHGVVFLAFVLVTVVLWVDQRWPLREVVLVLACAIPPFATLYAERRVERLQLLRRLRLTDPGHAQPGGLFAGAAMALSSVSVVANSLLLRRWKGQS